MCRIVASVKIDNAADLSKGLRCDALVDTGASLMVLPSAWKDRLGELESNTEVEVETATQERVRAVFDRRRTNQRIPRSSSPGRDRGARSL
jgi:predicted aspartyl protease